MGRYAAIKAIATYLPEEVRQNDASHLAQKLGIRERHIAARDEAASDLAVKAAEQLFVGYRLDRASIDFLLVCTQYPDYLLPTTACLVQSRLGLSERVGALDFNLGCSGYVYGLSLAKGLIESGLSQNMLLLTTSLYTKSINSKDATVEPLFGDGGTATLVAAVDSEKPLLDAFAFGTDGTGYGTFIIPAGGSRRPFRATPETFTTDERGNVRSNYEIYMDGPAIMRFSMRTVPMLVEKVLAKAHLERSALDGCVFHQANHYMLEQLRARCGLAEVPFYNDIERIGNTTSGTIPLGLASLDRQGRLASCRRVLLAGFGVGLSWAGCIADFSQLMPREKD